jgi:hypothetical protein
MRTTYGLVGLVLFIAGIGSAVASGYDSRDQQNPTHIVAADRGSAHDAGDRSTGDALGLTHGSSPQSSSDDSGSGSGNDSDHADGPTQSPAAGRPSHLGWQSLLPGSIQ